MPQGVSAGRGQQQASRTGDHQLLLWHDLMKWCWQFGHDDCSIAALGWGEDDCTAAP